MLNKWRLAGARYSLSLKKNLNSPILLLLTAFVIPSLGGTFTIYFINVQINIFCFSVLRSYYKKQQKTKSKRKSKKEKKREKKKTRKSCALHCGFIDSLSVSWKKTRCRETDGLARAGARSWPRQVHDKNTLCGFSTEF